MKSLLFKSHQTDLPSSHCDRDVLYQVAEQPQGPGGRRGPVAVHFCLTQSVLISLMYENPFEFKTAFYCRIPFGELLTYYGHSELSLELLARGV